MPISMIAVERIGAPLVIRYGELGESFVFNQAGQQLNLEGLICMCRQQDGRSIPCGTPVKDSQVAKVIAADSHLLACIYAPRTAVATATLHSWIERLASGLRTWCEAGTIKTWVLPQSW